MHALNVKSNSTLNGDALVIPHTHTRLLIAQFICVLLMLGGPTPPPRPNDLGGGGMDSGSVAGISIFMIALGGAFGVGGLWYYQKRRGAYVVASTAMGHGAF